MSSAHSIKQKLLCGGYILNKHGFGRATFFVSCFLLVSVILAAIATVSARIFISEAESASACEGRKPLPTVIIDAGHGGRDGGASADDGTLEKALNLAVAKKLERLFSDAGYKTVMTRTEDVALGDENSSHKKLDDLRARVELAKEYENAIFISVHMNKFPVPKYSGLCVYFSKKTAGSHALAEEVRMTVAASLQKENSRQIKGAGSEIYVLYNAPCTAILVECGFLSNPSELAMLKTEEYQSKIAACIFTGAANYMSKTITEEVN